MYTITQPLLKIGHPGHESEWPDYLQQFNLTPAAIPELIAMLSDTAVVNARNNSKQKWALVHAWRALGQLRATAAIGPILNQLNAWEDNEFALEEIQTVLGMMGEPTIEPAFAFFMDQGNEEFGRVMAMDAMVKVAIHFPECVQQVIDRLGQYLRNPQQESTYLNELLIMNLAELDAVDCWDDIKRLITNKMTDLTSYDMQDAEMEFGLRSERETPRLGSDSEYRLERPESEAIEDILDYYFDKYGTDDSILSVVELDGFLASLCCAPKIMMPSIWMPAIWGGQKLMPDWESEQEITEYHENLMHAYNFVLAEFLANEFSARMYDENDRPIAIDEWCEGFLRGTRLFGPLNEDDQDVLDNHTQTMKLFVSAEGVDEILAMSTDKVLELQCEIEPDVRALFQHFFERRALTEHAPFVSAEPRIGRNDPCPCGSGKKFKKCCLH